MDTKCLNCGAKLNVDLDVREAVCQYCDAKFLVDNGVQHIRHDNVEDAGYQFEKGRQRAKQEYNQQPNRQPQNYQQPVGYQQPNRQQQNYQQPTGYQQPNYQQPMAYQQQPNYQQPNPYHKADYSKKKKNTVWWVLGWIFLFPVPLMILLKRDKKLKVPIKIAIIIAAWIIFLSLGLSGGAA